MYGVQAYIDGYASVPPKVVKKTAILINKDIGESKTEEIFEINPTYEK